MNDPRPIYVDFDDVLCETAREIARLLQHEFGRRVAFEDIRSFDLGLSFGLQAAEIEHLMRMTHQPAQLAAMPPIPDAVETLRLWANEGRRIHVVTGRPPDTAPVSRAWLADHRVPCEALLFVDKYDRGHPAADGVPVLSLGEIASLPFSLAIEDSPDMAVFLATHSATPVAVLDRPWNAGVEQRVPAGAALRRYRSWRELRSVHTPY